MEDEYSSVIKDDSKKKEILNLFKPNFSITINSNEEIHRNPIAVSEINPEFISKMPIDKLSQSLFDLSFSKNPNLIKYFPDQYITKEMAEYIKLYLPQYKRKIPLRFQEN